jgi:G3E family GTPase
VEAPPVPVTVLTGFLGSGKTTLLKRILGGDHGRRIAVIENEYGEIGIDQELVFDAEEEIFVANNGCLCCTVRGDLIRILDRLMARRSDFDHILIETTGLAAPGPVAQTFFADEQIASRLRLDGIVTLVDALNLERQLGESPQTREQIAFADVLLLNKTDLVPQSGLERTEHLLRRINSTAPIHRSRQAAVDLDQILDLGAFALDRALELDPHFLQGDGHHDHDEEIGSVGICLPGVVDAGRFEVWLTTLLMELGPAVFRMKGVLNLVGEPCRVVFQGVYMHFDCEAIDAWGERPRLNQLVFIGRRLDRQEFVEGFKSCLTGSQD